MERQDKTKRLSDQGIREFSEIYADEFGETLSRAELEDMALRLLSFFDLLAKPQQDSGMADATEEEQKLLRFLQGEIEQGRNPSVRDITRFLGLRSSRSGFRALKALQDRGLVFHDAEGRLGLTMDRGSS